LAPPGAGSAAAQSTAPVAGERNWSPERAASSATTPSPAAAHPAAATTRGRSLRSSLGIAAASAATSATEPTRSAAAC